MKTKTFDHKGRITLGPQYAGKIVLVDESNPDSILLKPVVIIPAEEAWLYKNEVALGCVREGLHAARHKTFLDTPPDVKADLKKMEDMDQAEV